MENNEIWKPVEGYTGYEVSNKGRVRKVGRTDTLRMVKGYGMRRVTLRKQDEYHLVPIAKLVLENFVCKKPAGMKAVCIDGNYENLCVENLQWAERYKKFYRKNRYKVKPKPNEGMLRMMANHVRWIKQNKENSTDDDNRE